MHGRVRFGSLTGMSSAPHYSRNAIRICAIGVRSLIAWGLALVILIDRVLV
jgi:hypothetical protein